MKTQIYNACMALVVVSLLFSSCSVQKRHYRPGFHIEAKKHVPVAQPKDNKPESEPTIQPVEEEYAADDFANDENLTASNEVKPIEVVSTPAEPVKKETKKATVKKPVSTKELGSKDFKYDRKQNAKHAYKAGPAALLGDDKLVAILLCIFLGWLGIHRFYLGYITSGIVYIALFIASVVLGGFVLGFVGWICGVILFVLIILDLIFLIVDKPLFWQS